RRDDRRDARTRQGPAGWDGGRNGDDHSARAQRFQRTAGAGSARPGTGSARPGTGTGAGSARPGTGSARPGARREQPPHRPERFASRGEKSPRWVRGAGDSHDRYPQDTPQRRPQHGSQHRPQDGPQKARRPVPGTQGEPRQRAEHPAYEPVVEVTQEIAGNGFAALGLPDRLVRRLAQDGITTPFPIQAATIPDALAGRDVLGRGRTGSGKTLAFGLPMLVRLAAGPTAAPHQPRAIVLTPTRELAMQVGDALRPAVHTLGLSHKLVAGGMPYTPQLQALERGVDLLVATPGRLSDLVERGAADLSQVQIAVLDEADHMAEMGFLEAITEILDLVPAGGQRLLFSATLDRGIDAVVQRYLVDPVTHSTDAATASVTTMAHHVVLVEPAQKKAVTAEVAGRAGRTLVFVRTKLGADRVAEQLREQGVFAAALHGGLGQGARNRVLSAFRDGTLPVLVATDVAARGIHVDDVGVVLQVDPPKDHKDYLHRAGRTARAGDAGTVVTLALPHQKRSMEQLAREAGVEVVPFRAAPGDMHLRETTGARIPSGVPILDSQLRRVLEGEQRRQRRPVGRDRRRAGSGPARDRR
ncbi:MAG TPA: DEAD/DEAH box helicase, partial [Dermatophilaceae bacterium]|nr:DEAD/DEAH box helicase [Dermatophilaceae bacterium]